jgi:lipopolysaccharide biosynthesis protein
MLTDNLRALAIHLPQFHPIKENDQWWGKGFTEWTNVTKAKPLFEGHYQPHLPSDLGFYDLRLEESRIAQAELARDHGIYGFCYYHYWFNGKLVLEKPVEAILKSGKPDFPFCLCWANENWSRNWDGKFNDVLLEQKYNHEDDLEHIRFLFPYFSDSRYIRVNGKPVFIVYRSELFPNIQKTIEIWRNEAIKTGIGDLYLIRAESFLADVDPVSLGFDASFEFQPKWNNQPPKMEEGFLGKMMDKLGIKKSIYIHNRIRDYAVFAERQMNSPDAGYKRFPGITPMWDNTARRKNDAYILKDATPEKYGIWLENIVQRFKPYSSEENFIFINAWNEWAEGNHLEPCSKWGLKYLEETRKKLTGK